MKRLIKAENDLLITPDEHDQIWSKDEMDTRVRDMEGYVDDYLMDLNPYDFGKFYRCYKDDWDYIRDEPTEVFTDGYYFEYEKGDLEEETEKVFKEAFKKYYIDDIDEVSKEVEIPKEKLLYKDNLESIFNEIYKDKECMTVENVIDYFTEYYYRYM